MKAKPNLKKPCNECNHDPQDHVYEGKDMLSTHKGLNISEHEFIATLDDALKARLLHQAYLLFLR